MQRNRIAMGSVGQGMGRRGLNLCVALAVVLGLAGAQAMAQTGGQGALQGTVTDSSGAVIPNAAVVATDQSSGVSTTRMSSSAGSYTITPLIPDLYTVTVTASGFQTLKQQNIVVTGLNITGYDAKLAIGSTEQTVTVTQAPPQLETTSPTLGGVITNETYESLPLVLNGQQRDPTAFATLEPGAQGGARAPIMSGTGNYLAEVYLDGIPTTTANQQGDNRVISNSIPIESVDQLRVISSGPSAEYQGAGAIGFTTKSGGNKYHGTVLDVIRNTAFDTWGFTAPAATTQTVVNGVITKVPAKKPVEHQNELSVSVGGPIPFTRHKGFFFTNYDKFHNRTGVNPSQFTVPTAKMKQGNFSELLSTIYTPSGCTPGAAGCTANPAGMIYDPLSTAACAAHNTGGAPCRYQYGYGPGAGVGANGNPVLTGAPINVIPASQLSAISLYEQKFLPDPTTAGIANNYLAGGDATGYDNWEIVGKVDFDLTASQRLSFVYTHGVRKSVGYGAQLPLPYTVGATSIISPTVMILEHSIVINPRLVNQFKYGFSRFPQPVKAPTDGLAPYRAGADIGIGGLPPGQASGNFPGISFGVSTAFPSALSPWTQGGAADATHSTVPNAYTLVDNLQWTKGRHSFTFGVQTQWLQDNVTSQSSPSGILQQGFAAASTSNFIGTSLNSTYTGYSYASFLLGAVNSGSTSVPLFAETGGRFHPISPYFQDDYKITPHLTVNLGLRYDYLPPYHEVQDRFSFFNPNVTNSITGTPGQLEFAGHRGADISCQCRTPVPTRFKNWGPRLGFEWSVDDKTVVRGGYAIAYSRAGGVGGRAGDSTGTGQAGYGANIILPAAISTGANAAPSYYLNNSPAFQSAGLGNTNFGGPGYVIPPLTGPNAAALTQGTGNYVNSAGAYVQAGGAPGYADPYLASRPPAFTFYNFGMQKVITPDLTIMVNYSGSQSHFVAGAGVPGFWSGQLDPTYLVTLGSVLASDNATNILNAQATPANIAIAQKADPRVTVPYAGYAAAGAISTVPTIARMLRPFPQYSAPPSATFDNIANISYNSLQITLNQREWKGLNFNLNYTYSRNIGDDGTTRSAFAVPAAASSSGIALPGNNRADRALTVTDTPEILNIYGVDRLPFGKGHMGGENWLVRNLVGGWALSGIFTYSAGTPVLVTASGCNTPSSGTCMPDFNPAFSGSARKNGSWGKGLTAGNLSAISYLDSNAFRGPQNFPLPANANAKAVALTKIGTSPRSAAMNLRSPSRYNINLSVRRSFNITPERLKFSFQADCFDVTNKVNFSLNSTNSAVWSSAASSTFGQMTSAGGNRDFQFAGRFDF